MSSMDIRLRYKYTKLLTSWPNFSDALPENTITNTETTLRPGERKFENFS